MPRVLQPAALRGSTTAAATDCPTAHCSMESRGSFSRLREAKVYRKDLVVSHIGTAGPCLLLRALSADAAEPQVGPGSRATWRSSRLVRDLVLSQCLYGTGSAGPASQKSIEKTWWCRTQELRDQPAKSLKKRPGGVAHRKCGTSQQKVLRKDLVVSHIETAGPASQKS